MTSVLDTATPPAPASVESVDALSADERKGVDILGALDTVVCAKALGEPIDDVVKEIFRHDIYTDPLSRYLRKMVGFGLIAQKALVKRLLSHCGFFVELPPDHPANLSIFGSSLESVAIAAETPN